MKKIVFLLSFCSLFISKTFAQNDARATKILDEMSKKYKNMKSFKASFSYGTEGDNKKYVEAYKGDVTVKGTKFRLKMAGQDIFNNGKDIYSYSKETNEVNVTKFNPNNDPELSPTRIYSIYQNGYKYVFLEEQKEGGESYEVIELSPDDKKSKVVKVQLKINKKDKTVKSWKVWDKGGKRQVFKMDKFMPNAAFDESIFTFDPKKYPGVEVVDLR